MKLSRKTRFTSKTPKKQVKVKKIEHEIDRLVYPLYGLTQKEVRIVEGEK